MTPVVVRRDVHGGAAGGADVRGVGGVERRIVEMHIVDVAVHEVGACAVELSAADDRRAGCLPAAAVGDGGLEDAIDVEQELAGRDIVDADQVVPDPC